MRLPEPVPGLLSDSQRCRKSPTTTTTTFIGKVTTDHKSDHAPSQQVIWCHHLYKLQQKCRILSHLLGLIVIRLIVISRSTPHLLYPSPGDGILPSPRPPSISTQRRISMTTVCQRLSTLKPEWTPPSTVQRIPFKEAPLKGSPTTYHCH